MGVASRYNSSGFKDYSDPGVRFVRREFPTGPAVETYTASLVNRVNHVHDKSVVTPNALWAVKGGTRVRDAGNYFRNVMDLTKSDLETVTTFYHWRTGAMTERRTEREPFSPPYGWIPSQSQNHGVYWPTTNTDAVNQAIVQALNKLGDQKVQIGAALAEAKKTLDMISDVSSSVLYGYRALKYGNYALAFKHLGLSQSKILSGRSSANYLLGVKYGVVPLLKDVYNGYQWFVDNRETPLLLRVKSAATRTTPVNGSYRATSWKGTATHIGFCGITAMVSGDFIRGINQGGLANPASIAWELVPFSFVVDWFMPIGNVLQAYSSCAGLTFVTGYTGSRNESSVKFAHRYIDDSPGNYLSVANADAELRGFSTRRDRLYGFPWPNVYAKQNVFNSDKATTALLLLRSLMR